MNEPPPKRAASQPGAAQPGAVQPSGAQPGARRVALAAGRTLLPWITVPTLLLDETRVRRNIRRMVERTQRAGVRLRPHFKTHQSAEIGEWFRERGVHAITVSSLRMAACFAEAGWRDILVAFPLNLRELPAAAALAQRCRLGLLVDSPAAVTACGAAISAPLDLWFEVDTGYARSGAPVTDVARFGALLEAARLFPHMQVRGLLSHTGQSYAARGPALFELHRQTVDALQTLQAALAALPAAQGRRLEISLGDTPLASLFEPPAQVDELRPGNFAFYDWMQVEIGACSEDQIAVALAAPVVGVYPERREVVVYGGAVHLSKEALPHAGGGLEYGRVAPLAAHGWGAALPGAWLRSLSQEHGIIAADAATWQRDLAGLRLGDLVAILPVHSCLTADLMKEYFTLDGRRIAMLQLEVGGAHAAPPGAQAGAQAGA